jgi:hypothetical protein
MKRRVWNSWTLLVALLGGTILSLALAGCATIMQGTSQSIGFSTTPTGATVSVDGVTLGKTPVISSLSRKGNHVIKLELAGFMPYETTMTRKVNGWVWGNLIFGGIPGLVVDLVTGGVYKLTPEQIQAELKKEGTSIRLQDDMILIGVTMRPDPAWVQIGTLTPDTSR